GLARPAAHEGYEALVRLLVEALQLDEGLRVIVDAQVELGVLLGRMDEEGGRLLAALVAAGGLTDLKSGDQPFGKWASARSFVRVRRFADDLFAGEHVARD